jgi:4'-phosphopantetheinyl transferase
LHCPACGGPAGKPVLAGRPPGEGAGSGLSFSLAHSGDAVAIAVARSPVGIDVERNATGCVCSLAPAMHPDDTALAEALPEPERHAAIIRWWVRIEAVLKCAGTGIAHGMDVFPVLGAPARPAWPGAPSRPCPRQRATRRRSRSPGSP